MQERKPKALIYMRNRVVQQQEFRHHIPFQAATLKKNESSALASISWIFLVNAILLLASENESEDFPM